MKENSKCFEINIRLVVQVCMFAGSFKDKGQQHLK